MIRFQRTARISSGRAAETTKWAKEVTEYINKNVSGATLQVFGQYFGDISVLVWQADLDSLASLEKWVQAIQVDKGYQELLAKSSGMLVEGSISDNVLAAL